MLLHISCTKTTSCPHHFLHQTDELHEASAELGNLFLHFSHMLLVDLHQRLEGVATMLDTTKTHQRFPHILCHCQTHILDCC